MSTLPKARNRFKISLLKGLIMPERLSGEKSFIRKALDKGLLAASLVTFPVGLFIAGTSLLSAEFLRAGVASGFAYLDYLQISEHGKEKKSLLNTERAFNAILDHLPFRGSNRSKNPTRSMVMATGSY